MGNLHTTFTGSIPGYYDRCLGPALFAPFGGELAARVPSDPGGDLLEIACGTGLVTRQLRRRLAPARRLVASDLSKPMLDYARGKLADVRGIEYREADAQKLPFGDGEFGGIACAFGVMFMPDKTAAFSEARRVLGQGGTFTFSTWDRIQENVCSQIYADTIESLFPGDEEMHFRLPWEMHDDGVIRRFLDSAGFGDVHIERTRLPIRGVDARTVAEGQVRGTPRGLLLEKKGMKMEEAIELVTAALEEYSRGKELHAHGQALMIEARAA